MENNTESGGASSAGKGESKKFSFSFVYVLGIILLLFGLFYTIYLIRYELMIIIPTCYALYVIKSFRTKKKTETPKEKADKIYSGLISSFFEKKE